MTDFNSDIEPGTKDNYTLSEASGFCGLREETIIGILREYFGLERTKSESARGEIYEISEKQLDLLREIKITADNIYATRKRLKLKGGKKGINALAAEKVMSNYRR